MDVEVLGAGSDPSDFTDSDVVWTLDNFIYKCTVSDPSLCCYVLF